MAAMRSIAGRFLALVAWSLLAQTAAADLVGYWNFDGTLDDGSGVGNNGTFAGAPLPSFSTDTPLILGGGQSVSFGGGSGHVLVPHNPSLDTPTALTIAAWVKPAGVGWDGILAKSPGVGSGANFPGNYELRIENGSRALTFLHELAAPNTVATYSSTGTVLNGLWQHVAVTAQAGGNVNFYINGALSGTAATNPAFGGLNPNPLYIGSRADLFTTMDGFLDEVTLFNEALTQEQIAELALGPGGMPPEQHPGLRPIYARASSEFTGDGRLAVHAVNGNGLVGKVHVSGPPGGTMWLTNGADGAPQFEMDLNGVYSVDTLRVYNYNENANPTCCLGRGVREVDIYVAGADGVYGATPALTHSFAAAPGTNTDYSEVVSLGGVQARYVRLNVRSNHGDPSFSGLSEVKVAGTSVPGQAPLPATIEAVSSNLVGFNRRAEYVVDGAGKGFGDTHSNVPDGTMWLNQGSFEGGAPDTNPEITFDLGSEVALGRMKVWNYAEYRDDLRNPPVGPPRFDELLGRGIHFADVLVAGEDGVFHTLISGQEFFRVPDLGPLEAFLAFDTGQEIDLGGVVARYVKFDILSNHNGKIFDDPLSDDGLFNFAGLSEVQFFPVPEPASYVWGLAVGLAVIGSRYRRRQAARG